MRVQRRREKQKVSPDKAIARLECDPAQARLAPVEDPLRAHLHQGPEEIPRLAGAQAELAEHLTRVEVEVQAGDLAFLKIYGAFAMLCTLGVP